jgi:hypothetical protein
MPLTLNVAIFITVPSRRGQSGPQTQLQLSPIAQGKATGFSLAEMAGMFDRGGAPHLARADLHHRADALDRQIGTLTTLRNALRHVADCPAPSHMECPTFQRLVRIAGRQSQGARASHARKPLPDVQSQGPAS